MGWDGYKGGNWLRYILLIRVDFLFINKSEVVTRFWLQLIMDEGLGFLLKNGGYFEIDILMVVTVQLEHLNIILYHANNSAVE